MMITYFGKGNEGLKRPMNILFLYLHLRHFQPSGRQYQIKNCTSRDTLKNRIFPKTNQRYINVYLRHSINKK